MSQVKKGSIQDFDLFAASNVVSHSNSIRPSNIFDEFEEKDIEQSISKRFEEQVDKYPDKLAVVTNEKSFTYKQLNNYSNIIAREVLNNYDDSLVLSENEINRYSRQMLLHGWGIESQEKLKSTCVFVAGAGGSGSPLVMQLALLGIGKIIICDDDDVELSNLNRQVLHDESRIGMNKALSAKKTVNILNPNIEVVAIKERVSKKNILDITQDASIIFDNIDDMETKFLLSDIAVKRGIPHIISSMIDMNAYAAIFHTPHTACFHCIYDKSTVQETQKLSNFVDNYKKNPNPVASPSLFMVTGFVVNEALKLILNIGKPAYNKYFFFGQREVNDVIYSAGYQAIVYPFSKHFRDLSRMQGVDWEGGWKNKSLEEISIEKNSECLVCNDQNNELLTNEDKLEREQNQKFISRTPEKCIDKSDSLQIVALLFEHGSEMIAGIMGTLKSGKAYVPLDVSYPKSRLSYMLEDSKARLIVTNNENIEFAYELRDQVNGNISIINISILDENCESENLNLDIPNENLAYVLYTSGSTGEPKGVMQNQINVLHHARVYINALHICTDDKLSLFSTYSFDAAKMDIYGSLLTGATLYPYDIKKETDLQNMSNWIEQEGITIFHSIPTVYRYFISVLPDNYVSKSLRVIVLGGEAVFKNDVLNYRKFFNDECLFINGLGPTESTLAMQFFVNKQSKLTKESLPIGFGVDKTEAFLLDENDKEVSVLEVGEITFKSPYLALGYLNKKEKTEQVFTKDPRTGDGRIYRTGDLGRLLPDGSIEFVGRKDFQIKIRGYRVELGEIEGKLDQIEEIDKSIVLCKQKGSENYLIAYYQLKLNVSIEEKIILKALKDSLPEYMIPNQFISIDDFPKTSTGKIDRKALFNFNTSSSKNYIAPKNDIEIKLVKMWSDVLDVDQDKISVTDNFFELGGHSLKATILLSRINKDFNILIPLLKLFESPTIEKIATIIFHQMDMKKVGAEIEI